MNKSVNIGYLRFKTRGDKNDLKTFSVKLNLFELFIVFIVTAEKRFHAVF